MDKILPVLGNMLGCRSLQSQELQEMLTPVNQQSLAPYSHQMLSFNPQQGSSSLSFVVQPVDQPARLLDNNQYESSTHVSGNSQWTSGTGELILLADENENKEPEWQRIRWTDDMVKVLITAVSYVVKALADYGRGQLLVPIKGKWRAVSNALVGRGYLVSPQQCEDKFNDINRKYKRLTDILGCVTSDVVKDPTLLDSVRISDEAKDEVRKILACRQLFYREMCSFHNWNRQHLPHDHSLEQAVISALTGKGKSEFEKMNSVSPAKRQKLGDNNGAPNAGHARNAYTVASIPEAAQGHGEDMNQEMLSRVQELKEKRQQIQKQMLDLEKKRIEWLMFCLKQDKKLRKVKVENKLMKLENELLLIDIKNREINAADHN